MNLTVLAQELGVSRPTLNKYRKEGLPVGDVAACKAWILQRKASDGRGGKRDRDAAGGSFLALKEQLQRANLRKIEAEARLKEYEASVAQRDLVSMDVARAHVAEILSPLRALLDALPQSAGPRANPSDPALGEQAIREGVEAVFKAMDKQRDGGADNVG